MHCTAEPGAVSRCKQQQLVQSHSPRSPFSSTQGSPEPTQIHPPAPSTAHSHGRSFWGGFSPPSPSNPSLPSSAAAPSELSPCSSPGSELPSRAPGWAPSARHPLELELGKGLRRNTKPHVRNSASAQLGKQSFSATWSFTPCLSLLHTHLKFQILNI